MKDVRILSIFEAENPGFNSNLTKTDLEILEILIKEPRQKIENISKDTGLSTKTVTRCIDKLQENDGIQFTVIYDPTKIEDFIPHAILAWIEGDFRETLEKMNNEFHESYMQIPFIAKNQIVLFMYSHDIFEMDELTQRVRNMDNVRSADLFIPKNISFPLKWLEQAINDAKKSSTLHLSYQTN
jgi:DNA-binding Lrp family transcriptional regulator